MLSLLTTRRRDDQPGPLSAEARRELEERIEAALANHSDAAGAASILQPGLRIVLTVDGIRLEYEDALAQVLLHDLNIVRSYLVIRDDLLAVPRDILRDIASQATRKLVEQLRQLEKPTQ